MGKTKEKKAKKRAEVLKDRRLSKRKGRGKDRRASSGKSHAPMKSSSAPAKRSQAEVSLQRQLRESEQVSRELRSELDEAKLRLHDLAFHAAKSRARDLKALANDSLTWLGDYKPVEPD